MKKWMIILVLFMMVISLSSCSEQSDPTSELISQFDAYTALDIADQHTFNTFINGVSNEVVPGFVLVKMTVKNSSNQVIRTVISTGFVYDAHENTIRIVASLDAVLVGDDNLIGTYEVIDYADRSYPATITNRSLDYGMAKLQINTSVSTSKIVDLDLAEYVPFDQEPLLMLSNFNQVRNAMQMGSLLSKTSLRYQTSLDIDPNSLGAVLINMRKEVIGLVVSIDEDDVTIMGLEALKDYLKQ